MLPRGLRAVVALTGLGSLASCAAGVAIGATPSATPQGQFEAAGAASVAAFLGFVLLVGAVGLAFVQPWARVLVMVTVGLFTPYPVIFTVAATAMLVGPDHGGLLWWQASLLSAGFGLLLAVCAFTMYCLAFGGGRAAFAARREQRAAQARARAAFR